MKNHVFVINSSSSELIANAIVSDLEIDPDTVLFAEARSYKAGDKYSKLSLPPEWRNRHFKLKINNWRKIRSRNRALIQLFKNQGCADVTWYFPNALELMYSHLVSSDLGHSYNIFEDGKAHYIYGADESFSKNTKVISIKRFRERLSELNHKLCIGSRFKYIPQRFTPTDADTYYCFDKRAFRGINSNRKKVINFSTAMYDYYGSPKPEQEAFFLVALDKTSFYSQSDRRKYVKIVTECIQRHDHGAISGIAIKHHPEDISQNTQPFTSEFEQQFGDRLYIMRDDETMESWMLKYPKSTLIVGASSLSLYALIMGVKTVLFIDPLIRNGLVLRTTFFDRFTSILKEFRVEFFDIDDARLSEFEGD